MTDISHLIAFNHFAMIFLLAMLGLGYLLSKKGK